jgi:hypothetical protein
MKSGAAATATSSRAPATRNRPAGFATSSALRPSPRGCGTSAGSAASRSGSSASRTTSRGRNPGRSSATPRRRRSRRTESSNRTSNGSTTPVSARTELRPIEVGNTWVWPDARLGPVLGRHRQRDLQPASRSSRAPHRPRRVWLLHGPRQRREGAAAPAPDHRRPRAAPEHPAGVARASVRPALEGRARVGASSPRHHLG